MSPAMQTNGSAMQGTSSAIGAEREASGPGAERPVISCRALTKTYGEGPLAVRVLAGVDFDVAAGEEILHQFRIPDVPLHQFHSRSDDGLAVAEPKTVEHNDPFTAFGKKPGGMGADITGSAGDEQGHTDRSESLPPAARRRSGTRRH